MPETAVVQSSNLNTNAEGWKLFENKDLGYRFSYPENWLVSETQKKDCSYFDKEISNDCPVSGTISPQAYKDYVKDKYPKKDSSLVNYYVYRQSPVSLENLFKSWKTHYGSVEGYSPQPSRLISGKGWKGFYHNQVGPSYSDNMYMIELDPGKYIFFHNRESELDVKDDYTQYSDTVDYIIKNLEVIN